MPWFPDFVAAAELVRRETRAAGQVDPVGQYLTAIEDGDAHALETVWPGEVEVLDPLAGDVRGHRQLRQFVRQSQAMLAERHAIIETVASTSGGGRAVVEYLSQLDSEGRRISWPVAVVAESPDERSVVFRTYCSQWPVVGRRPIRPPILDAGQLRSKGVVGRYQAALDAGDIDGIVSTFAESGYVREPGGSVHRGTDELRSFYADCFSAGGIGLELCSITDDQVQCAVEYNCVRWGNDELAPQAGLMVFERDGHGHLAGIRVYDDVERPGDRA